MLQPDLNVCQWHQPKLVRSQRVQLSSFLPAVLQGFDRTANLRLCFANCYFILLESVTTWKAQREHHS